MQRLPRRRDEIGKLSESLIDMTDELQKRMAATAGFAADVAHELKNPLSSLRSAAETISRISDPEAAAKADECNPARCGASRQADHRHFAGQPADNEMASEARHA
jgi:signal transduction histidine kinase